MTQVKEKKTRTHQQLTAPKIEPVQACRKQTLISTPKPGERIRHILQQRELTLQFSRPRRCPGYDSLTAESENDCGPSAMLGVRRATRGIRPPRVGALQ